MPKILILQIKRFQQRRSSESASRSGMYGSLYAQIGGTEKNNSFVNFPLEGLDMRQFVRELQDAPEPVLYDLIGVTNHFGTLNSGHYTASCKNPSTGEWHEFNDSTVSRIESPNRVRTAAAYVLWYRARD